MLVAAGLMVDGAEQLGAGHRPLVVRISMPPDDRQSGQVLEPAHVPGLAAARADEGDHARALRHMVQRGHPYAIVDEVDSILIDEARTPLIISGPASDVTKLYYQFASIARTLVRAAEGS